MSKTEFLFLSEDDLLKTGVLDADKCVDTCEKSIWHIKRWRLSDGRIESQ